MFVNLVQEVQFFFLTSDSFVELNFKIMDKIERISGFKIRLHRSQLSRSRQLPLNKHGLLVSNFNVEGNY